MLKQDILQRLTRKLTERYQATVETAYCLEHDQFARLVIIDEENGQWHIEGCCPSLVEKAKAAIRES